MSCVWIALSTSVCPSQNPRKVFVFIDDLDRCSEDSIMQVSTHDTTSASTLVDHRLLSAPCCCVLCHSETCSQNTIARVLSAMEDPKVANLWNMLPASCCQLQDRVR